MRQESILKDYVDNLLDDVIYGKEKRMTGEKCMDCGENAVHEVDKEDTPKHYMCYSCWAIYTLKEWEVLGE